MNTKITPKIGKKNMNRPDVCMPSPNVCINNFRKTRLFILVAEINADCKSNCNIYCYYRSCKAYASAVKDGKCYCCCIDCQHDSFFTIGHVNQNTRKQHLTDEM